jgi:hypothetical protein
MNNKFFIAWVVTFVVWMFGSFVVHGVLLESDYMQLQNLFRTQTDSQQYFPWMIVAHIIMSGAFVWIYRRGVQAQPWLMQGIGFGVAVALLNVVPIYLIYYVVQPMPGLVAIKQIAFDSALLLLLGMVVAFLYRDVKAK